MCDGPLLAQCSKLKVAMGHKPSGLELNYPTRQQRPWDLLLWRHVLPGATVVVASAGEQSLWALGVLGPSFLHWVQGGQSRGAAASSGEQSLQAAGALRLDFLHRPQEA